MFRIFNSSGKCCLLLFGMTLWITPAEAWPREINSAEEAAVRLVVAHLTSGPSALWSVTSTSSRFHELGAEEGTKEIEFRVGPGPGSEWELVTTSPTTKSIAAFHVTFPSGVDDTVEFAMVLEKGKWRIKDIRSMSDAVTPVGSAPLQPAVPVNDKTGVPSALPWMLGAGALLCGGAAFFVRVSSRRRSYLLVGSAALALVSLATVSFLRHPFVRTTPLHNASVLANSSAASASTGSFLSARSISAPLFENGPRITTAPVRT